MNRILKFKSGWQSGVGDKIQYNKEDYYIKDIWFSDTTQEWRVELRDDDGSLMSLPVSIFDAEVISI